MKAIFGKEFRSAVLSYAGIAFIGIFLCFAGIMTAYWNFKQLSSSFEVIFAYMPFAAIALIPLLTVGAFSNERVRGNDRFLAILPISTRDIVLGKYFSRLAVAMIPNVVMAFFPIILDIFGDINYATAYTVLLVFSLLEAMLIALCLYIDVFFKHRYVRIAAPYAILIIWFAIGKLGEIVSTSNAVLKVIHYTLVKASPFKLFDGFLYGIVDFRTVFVYIALTVLFLALTVLAFYRKDGIYAREDHKKTALRKASLTLSLVMLAAVLFANIGVMVTPDRLAKIDITKEKTYTLSDETKDFLDSLEKDVTVYAINFEDSEYRIRLFLDRMASYSDHLTVKDIDTAKDSSLVEKYGLDSLDAKTLENSMIVESSDRAQMIYYSSLFTYTNEILGFERISASEFQYYYSIYASSTEYAQYANYMLTDTDMYFEGQSIIPRYIEYAAADHIPSTYILGGHGIDLSNSFFSYLCTYYGMTYNTLEISEGESVPDDVASLIIASPATDLTDSELEAIKAYLAKGGQITVLTNENNLSMTNLMSLLASYGMSADTGIINDTVTAEGENADEASTEETSTLTLTPNHDHDILATGAGEGDGYSFTVTNANALTLTQNVDPSLLLTPLLKTADTAYLNGSPDTKSSYTVAAAAELSRGDRVVWFTGADSFLGIGDVESVDEQQINNTMLVLLASQWTNNVYESKLSEAPASQYTVRGLEISETAATVLGMIFVAVIPAAAVAIAAMVRYKRERA